jgi:hypothetical protein
LEVAAPEGTLSGLRIRVSDEGAAGQTQPPELSTGVRPVATSLTGRREGIRTLGASEILWPRIKPKGYAK